jgi:hypothetical protein
MRVVVDDSAIVSPSQPIASTDMSDPAASSVPAALGFEDHLKRSLGPIAVSYRTDASPCAAAIALAGVPSTLLMVIAGLACALVVRHRREWAWLTVLAVKASLAGFSLIPRIAGRLVARGRTAAASVRRAAVSVAECAARVETVETSFVGLLRRLGGEPAEAAFADFTVPGFPTAVRGKYAPATAVCAL